MDRYKPYQPVVASLINTRRPGSILDAPSGSGWLKSLISHNCPVDGVDLFASSPPGYRNFKIADLGRGLPRELGTYEAIVCCEGIEHFGNPEIFFSSAREHLSDNGLLIVTTPNVWYPAARLQYLLRGFSPSFPCLAGKIRHGTHMHIMPWSFPQLFLYLSFCGFKDIKLHEVNEPKPKRIYERILGLPQKLYCSNKARNAQTEIERIFWLQAGSRQSIFGRRLVVSAVPA